MKQRWTKCMAVLGIVAVVSLNNSMMLVKAESGDAQSNTLQEDTENEANDADGTENSTTSTTTNGQDADNNATETTDEQNTDNTATETTDEQDTDSTATETTDEQDTDSTATETTDEQDTDSTATGTADEQDTDNTAKDNINEQVADTNTESTAVDENADNDSVTITDDIVKDDLTTDESAGNKLQAATDLKWDVKEGTAVFYNPNEQEVTIVAHLYREPYYGEYGSVYTCNAEKGEVRIPFYCYFDYYHDFWQDSTYTYTIKIYNDGENENTGSEPVYSDTSDKLSHSCSGPKLDTPTNIRFRSDGMVTWDPVDQADGYCFYGSGIGTTTPFERFTTSTSVDVSDLIEEGENPCVRVRAVKKDITNYCCRLESSAVYMEKETAEDTDNQNAEDQNDSSDSGEQQAAAPPWKPVTPDEIKHYSFVGKENVSYTQDSGNPYDVKIYNAAQGKLCFDVFEAVLDDYTMARTYNIFPTSQERYSMEESAKITLNIPTDLKAAGRQYRMICVTEKGVPVILEDIDTNPDTITFETNAYYAFALVYKDNIIR